MRRSLKTLLLLLFALALAALALANRAPVALALPATDLALVLPLWTVFFLGLLCGVLLAGAVTLVPRARTLLDRRAALRRAEKAEARLAEIDESRAAQHRETTLAAIEQSQRGHS